MDDHKNQRKWRHLLINPQYQIKYVFWISATGMTLTLVNGAVFYFFVRENYKILVDMSPMEDEVRAQLYRELFHILLALGAFAVLFLALTAFFGILLSHRTAGPMYHFKRVFREIQQGNVQARVRLRPHDDFRDVADECNGMIDFLMGRSSSSP